MDAQRDQDVRIQVGVHVRVQVGPEFIFPGDIGLDQRLPGAQPVLPGLAHQRLGDGGNGGLALARPVRIDVGDLGVAKPQGIDGPVGSVDIAGHLSPDDLEPVFVEAQGQTAQTGQIGDQVAGLVVGRPQHIGQRLPLHMQIYDDILFFIQIKMSEIRHT